MAREPIDPHPDSLPEKTPPELPPGNPDGPDILPPGPQGPDIPPPGPVTIPGGPAGTPDYTPPERTLAVERVDAI